MSTQAETTEQKTVNEAALWLRHAIEEAKTLQIVERILAGVIRTEFHRVPEQYDAKALREAMRVFNQAITERDASNLHELRGRVESELHLWRVFISECDKQIMTYSLRRFCERTDQCLDTAAFAAMARFYRSCPHNGAIQSKFDLAITRLVAPVNNGNRRVLRIGREQLVRSLIETYAVWDGRASAPRRSQTDLEAAAKEFDVFIAEVEETKHFEDMITRDLPNRLRAFKSELGEAFYEPEITAVAIEYNVVAANKFCTLFEEESEHILNAPEAGRELADLFSDLSPDAPNQIERVLNEWRSAPGHDEEAEAGERLARLARLLSIGSAERDEPSTAETAVEGSDEAAAAAESERILQATLLELSKTDENKEVIADFLKASAEVRELDVAAFLGLPAEENAVDDREKRRQALRLIVQADALHRSKLATEGALNAETEGHLSMLLEELQVLGKTLRKLTSEALDQGSRANADILLYVASQVLEARLHLQSAIVRRSAGEIARAEEARAARMQAGANVVQMKARSGPRVALNRRRKLMIAAAIVLMMVSVGVRIGVQRMAPVRERDKDVRVLNRAELPGGELLADARLRRNIMIGVVADSWKQLAEERKREQLRQLLNYGKNLGVDSVMLLDGAGQPAGSASQTEIHIESDFVGAK